MQVLLIISNPVIKDLVSINLKTQLNIDVISRSTFQEALDLLVILPEVKLIIATEADTTQDEDGISKFAKELTNQEKKLSLLVLVQEIRSLDKIYHNSFIVPEDEWEELISLSSKILGIDKKEKNSQDTEYTSLPLEYFYNIKSTCCDVFIRIKKGKNDYQFIKRIHQGDVFSKEVIYRYQEQGLEYFFIQTDKIGYFSTYVSNQLIDRLNTTTNEVEKLEVLGNTYDIAAKEIARIGFNSSTIQLTESLVLNIIDTMKKEKIVSHLLRKIVNSKTGYIYQHSHLTTVVASEIISGLQLKGKDTVEKIAYASIFKDISLANNQDLASICTIEDLEKANLDEEKWDLVFNHALDGAILSRQFSDAPLGIDDIIKHHHGAFNGKGFPAMSQETKLNEISLIFLISVEFVNELLRFKITGEAPRPIVELLYKKYTGPSAVKIIKTLEANLQKNINGSKK